MIAYWLGKVEYAAAWQLQKELAALRATGKAGDVLLLLEHPPTITLGRSAHVHHVLASAEQLERLGVAVHHIDRGGDVTYHGPGQLVGYPIFHLAEHGKDLHQFLRRVEGALIAALATFGVEGRHFPPHTGVWVDHAKIAAIGIKVTRWVSTHGFALNVSPDLTHFDLIVPCGIRDYGVTSLHAVLGYSPAFSDLLPPIVDAFQRMFPGSDPVCNIPLELLSESSRKIVEAGKIV